MKGILFKPDMHKAIREGRKTVTRRIIKPQPPVNNLPKFNGAFSVCGKDYKPRYQVGDIVYIREAYMVNKEYDHLKPSEIPEIGRKVAIWYYADGNHYADKVNEGAGKVRSPLFMPAWAARDFIQITGVRAERLQEITEEDAVAEGIKSDPTIAIYEYSRVWDSINKDYPWASNPWIFRYEFKRVDKPPPLV